MANRSAKIYALVMAVLLTSSAVVLQWYGSLQAWDNMIFDRLAKYFEQQPNSDIIIVTIDDRSLDSLGRWPWSRQLHAEFINKLTDAQVRAIGFDILFIEPDMVNPENDTLLAKAIQRNGKTVLPVVLESTSTARDVKVKLPLAELVNAAADMGHTNILPDGKGVVRGLYLSANINSGLKIPAFTKALSTLGQTDELKPVNKPGLLTPPASEIAKFSDYVRIPFSGSAGHYPMYSYVDVLRSDKLRKQFYDKYILIGLDATGFGSHFATSVSNHFELMSGIELNAHVLDMLIKKDSILLIKPISAALITAFLVFVPLVSYSFLSGRQIFLITVFFILISLVISACLLLINYLWFAPTPVILALLSGFLFWSSKQLGVVSKLLFMEKQKARATLQAIGDAVVTTNKQGKIEYMNPAAEKMAGYSLNQVKGQTLCDVFTVEEADQCKQFFEEFQNNISGDGIDQTEIKSYVNQSGQKYAMQLSANPIIERNGKDSGMVYAFNDLTTLLEISQRMAYVATHDTLTGLPNRDLLHDRLTQAIRLASRLGKHIVILFIDLDGFKKINDGLGHAGGDLVLKEIAKRLQSSVRHGDTTARWGGDEFVILMENLEHEEYVLEIVDKIVHNLSASLHVFNQEVFVTPSIGISLFPKDGETADALLARADAAMYSVKDTGRNGFNFYSTGLNDTARQRLQMEKEMHDALQQGEFEVFYQPLIDLKSQQIQGAEALLRWRHYEKGIILPGEFIYLAEETGLIVPIGDWLFQTVCRQLKQWHQRGIQGIQVAVNLSPRQFMQKNLLEMVSQCIEHYHIIPGTLNVEVTESIMMRDVEQAIKILQALKAIGVSVALDDFGTGYSSLSYLKRFPVDKLKIDKSFINNLFSDSEDASIVNAVILLGHNMNMQIVAEGIETRDQMLFLMRQGCDIGQGYYFDRPLKAEGMTDLLLEKTVLSE